MNPTLILLGIGLTSLVGFSSGYSAGAPLDDGICTSLRPNHPGEPQTEKMPYRITIDKKTAKVGEYITLQIRTEGNKRNIGQPVEKFKGFLVQGRKLSNEGPEEKPVGEFVVDSKSEDTQALNCGGIDNSAVTHMNGDEKSKVTVKWRAPKEAGTYALLTTIVQSGKVYWTRQPSSNITVTAA